MLLKTAFREIKTSLGRYLAILAIIALGVGFFAGLRVTRTAMISTANHYLKDLAMFDDRILSTLGWTEEDVDAFRKLDGVSAAEGARSADVLCVGEDGSDMVLKAHSLTQQVNRLSLQAGRLPEKADECVVDAWRYDESALGSVIRLSDNNSADTMDRNIRWWAWLPVLCTSTMSGAARRWETAPWRRLSICCRRALRWTTTRRST